MEKILDEFEKLLSEELSGILTWDTSEKRFDATERILKSEKLKAFIRTIEKEAYEKGQENPHVLHDCYGMLDEGIKNAEKEAREDERKKALDEIAVFTCKHGAHCDCLSGIYDVIEDLQSIKNN